jgi:hypothetical protein
MGIKERTIECDAVDHNIDEVIPLMIEHGNNRLFELRIKGGSIV